MPHAQWRGARGDAIETTGTTPPDFDYETGSRASRLRGTEPTGLYRRVAEARKSSNCRRRRHNGSGCVRLNDRPGAGGGLQRAVEMDLAGERLHRGRHEFDRIIRIESTRQRGPPPRPMMACVRRLRLRPHGVAASEIRRP